MNFEPWTFSCNHAAKLNEDQLGLLLESFRNNTYPDKEHKLYLAKALNVPLQRIVNWFIRARTARKEDKPLLPKSELYEIVEYYCIVQRLKA